MRLLVLTGAVLFLGCATGYGRKGFTGGYSETQIDRRVWTVNVRGNGWTSDERANDYLLLRSAELSLEAGCNFFVLGDGYDTSRYAVIADRTSANIIRKPGKTATLACFDDRPDDAPVWVYDAHSIYESIGSKYGVVDKPRRSAPAVQPRAEAAPSRHKRRIPTAQDYEDAEAATAEVEAEPKKAGWPVDPEVPEQ